MTCVGVQSQVNKATGVDDASLLRRSEKALTKVIVHDIFSPPVASRIYLYASIAAYEAVVPSQKKYSSLAASISSFPVIALQNKEGINYRLSSVYAFLKSRSNWFFQKKK
jgi:hypothetical protein